MIHLQRARRFVPEAEFPADRILHIPITEISPDPMQARKYFELDKLRELADSIAQFGVLSPLMVRRVTGGYQIIAGERRLRAAAMAGFTHVPCVIRSTEGACAACISLIENLQRCDLDFFEEAAGIARLIQEFGFTQEEAALRLGKSQSVVANKLRLLRLDGDTMAMIRSAGLTERHARALLRLNDSTARKKAITQIVRRSLNAAETDRYINELLMPHRRGTCTPILRDVRLFLNTVRNALKTANEGGIHAEMEQTETPEAITLVIRLPRKAGT